MSEEQEVVTPESTPPVEEKKTDIFEEKAIAMGWRPLEEWDGSEEDFIDAKEFVRRQPLFDKIAYQHKELKQLQQAFEAFKVHHSRVKENEYSRALETLKKARKEALASGETEQALAIEDKMDELKEQQEEFVQESSKQTQPTTPAQVNPAFTDWLRVNSWYQKDTAMTAYADKIGIELHNKGYTNDEVLKMVSNEVKKEFKHKFTNPNRDRGSSVESGSRKVSKTNGEDTSGMSEDDVRMMNKIIRAGGITREDYLKEYRRVQGL